MEAEQGDSGEWATRIADAVCAEFTRRRTYTTLQSIQAVSSEAVEVVYSWPGEDTLRGIRLDLSSVGRASERIRATTAGELAFDLVLVGMEEPRPVEDFTEPDAWHPVASHPGMARPLT
jgi:hypothetical protein